MLVVHQGKYEEAEALYRRAMKIAEGIPKPHPELLTVLGRLAGLLSIQVKRKSETLRSFLSIW